MKKHSFWFSLFLILLVPAFVMASNIKGGETVTIDQPYYGNFYAAGGKVYINAPIYGDLIAAGGDIYVRDSILGDILVLGGNLYIEGVVNEDLRVAGGKVTLSQNVGRDAVIAGGDIEVKPGVIIGGDLIVTGGNARVDATIKGNANIYAGSCVLNGVVEKTLETKGGELTLNATVLGPATLAARSLTLGSQALLHSPVKYWTSIGEVDFGNKLAEGASATFDEGLAFRTGDFNWRYFGLGVFLFTVFRLLAATLMIGILVWAFNRFFTKATEGFDKEWLNDMGIGLLYFIVAPLLIIIAFVTIIGIPLGLFGVFFFGTSMAFAHVITAVVAAYALEYRQHKNWSKRQLILVSLGLFFAIKLMVMIPIIGWVVSVLSVLVAFGIIINGIRNRRSMGIVEG